MPPQPKPTPIINQIYWIWFDELVCWLMAERSGIVVGWFAFFFVVGYGRQPAANAPQQRRRAKQNQPIEQWVNESIKQKMNNWLVDEWNKMNESINQLWMLPFVWLMNERGPTNWWNQFDLLRQLFFSFFNLLNWKRKQSINSPQDEAGVDWSCSFLSSLFIVGYEGGALLCRLHISFRKSSSLPSFQLSCPFFFD